MTRRAPVILAGVLAVVLPLTPPAAPPPGDREARARERAAAERMAEVLIREEEARRQRLAARQQAAATTGEALPRLAGAPAHRPAPGPAADGSLDQVFPAGSDAGGDAVAGPREYPSAFAVSDAAGALPRPPVPVAGRPAAVAAGDDGLELFHTGYSRFSQGDYPRAREAFTAFLRRQPGHDLAASAQYWIGECAYAQGDLEGALQEYRKVIDSFPFGNKVADALLKSGYVLLELGRTQEAGRLLQQLVEDHPGTGAAQRAAQRLGEAGLSPPVQ